jgi:negative regulator of flagellin synthesis FlgM
MRVGNNPEANAPKLEKPAARKPEVQNAATSAPTATTRAHTTEASTQVQISATAAKLASGNDGTFDTAKVQRISQAISEGKFKVDAKNVADKLISNAQELLSRSKRQQ